MRAKWEERWGETRSLRTAQRNNSEMENGNLKRNNEHFSQSQNKQGSLWGPREVNENPFIITDEMGNRKKHFYSGTIWHFESCFSFGPRLPHSSRQNGISRLFFSSLLFFEIRSLCLIIFMKLFSYFCALCSRFNSPRSEWDSGEFFIIANKRWWCFVMQLALLKRRRWGNEKSISGGAGKTKALIKIPQRWRGCSRDHRTTIAPLYHVKKSNLERVRWRGKRNDKNV